MGRPWSSADERRASLLMPCVSDGLLCPHAGRHVSLFLVSVPAEAAERVTAYIWWYWDMHASSPGPLAPRYRLVLVPPSFISFRFSAERRRPLIPIPPII